VLSLAACSRSAAPAAHPISPAVPAHADDAAIEKLALDLQTVGAPCDVAGVSRLMDRTGFLRLVAARAKDHHASIAATEMLFSVGANKMCAWLSGAADFRFLGIHESGNERRAVMRKVSADGFGYFEIRAGNPDAGLRILDVYSHNNGVWISDEVAEAGSLPADASLALKMAQINELDRTGKSQEALALLDSFPDSALNTRLIQSLRVAIAGRVSADALQQATEERARRLPGRERTPLDVMNAAFARGDFAEALHQVDVIDAAVGGDPFLDTLRASILAQRNGAGDLARAAELAERAVASSPQLAMPVGVKFTIAVARGQWSVALSSLEHLETRFDTVLSDEVLRSNPQWAPLVATPEYAGWKTRHP
jgi:hypothetical protein